MPRPQTTIDRLGYTFASSSERENTGSAGGYSQPSKDVGSEDEEDTRRRHDNDEEDDGHGHGSSPSPKHGMTMTSESNERARHPPSRDPSRQATSRGDFHSRNSGEATRSGFRVTCDSSAPSVVEEGVKEGNKPNVTVKVEEEEEEDDDELG